MEILSRNFRPHRADRVSTFSARRRGGFSAGAVVCLGWLPTICAAQEIAAEANVKV